MCYEVNQLMEIFDKIREKLGKNVLTDTDFDEYNRLIALEKKES